MSQVREPADCPIFVTATGKPLSLGNVVGRVVLHHTVKVDLPTMRYPRTADVKI